MVLAICLGLAMAEFPVPLERGHSHNDYYRSRPLMDALEAGLCSVEADVFLVDGALLVGHDRSELRADRTLSRLYLQPLADLARRHGGRVYPGWPEVTLLVDIKADGRRVFPVLLAELMKVEEAVGRRSPRAFRVVVSGDRPVDLILRDSEMWMAVDGRPGDLGKGYATRQMPMISTSWWDTFRWLVPETMPEDKRVLFHQLVRDTHAEGKRIRFWALPDNEMAWGFAWDGGVDWINTDRPDALKAWMRTRM